MLCGPKTLKIEITSQRFLNGINEHLWEGKHATPLLLMMMTPHSDGSTWIYQSSSGSIFLYLCHSIHDTFNYQLVSANPISVLVPSSYPIGEMALLITDIGYNCILLAA